MQQSIPIYVEDNLAIPNKEKKQKEDE